MAGTRRATSSNEARSSSSTTESRTATTVAVRNPPAKKAISPIGCPTPISARGTGSSSSRTSKRPDTTTNTASAGVFCKTSVSPLSRRRILARDQISAC
jgi:hypothetical protein